MSLQSAKKEALSLSPIEKNSAIGFSDSNIE
jgi:hypothetical protein